MVHCSTFQTPWYVPWSSSTKGYQYRIHPDGWSSPQALTKLNVWNRVGSNQKLLTSWIAEDYNLKPLGPECVAKRRFRIPTDCRAFRGSLQVGTSHLWWVNSHISRTWIVRPAMGMISLNHDSRVRSNSEVVIIYPDLWSQNHHPNTNCGLRSIRWASQLDIVFPNSSTRKINYGRWCPCVRDSSRSVGAFITPISRWFSAWIVLNRTTSPPKSSYHILYLRTNYDKLIWRFPKMGLPP